MRFVPIQSVEPGMIVGRDIISKNRSTMIRKGIKLTAEYITYLIGHGYIGLYVTDSISEGIEIKETISDKLFTAGVDAIAEENVGHIMDVATEIVMEILEQDDVSVDLIDLRSFDDYTYHHSVNVAVYAVAVGKKLGLSEKEITLLSEAAICHDLGKMHIPTEILNKPGKLTDEEYEIVKQHPQKSYDIISKNSDVSAVVKQAVLMHHENENGSGYPLHKQGSEISIITKIIHAVDVYDALTSRRPYKDPYAPVVAFDYLKGGCDILFDRRIVDAMTQVIPAFPPGMEVKLSDGRKAIVVAHTTDPLRPMIKTLEDKKVINLGDKEYDTLMIVESGVMDANYIEQVDSLNETRNRAPERRKRVMVVDDMRMSLRQTQAALSESYDVILAQSGLEALEMINKNGCPDLFIVDIEMPVMDGFAFVNSLRAKEIYDVPIIFLTTRVDKETVVKCIGMGAVDYIVKPAQSVYLKERVAIALKDQRE